MSFNANIFLSLLKELGQTTILRKRTAGAYDIVTGVVSQSTTDYSVLGAPVMKVLDDLDKDGIIGGYTHFVISHKQVNGDEFPAPDATDSFVFNGIVGDIVKVRTYSVNGNVVLYDLTVKDK